MPESALNMPGQQKHTKPMRTIWMNGELYLKSDDEEEEEVFVFSGIWVPVSSPLLLPIFGIELTKNERMGRMYGNYGDGRIYGGRVK